MGWCTKLPTKTSCAIAILFSAMPILAARPNVELRVTILPPSVVIAYPGRGASHDWPKYCSNLEMTGVAASERVISKDSVVKLQLAWKDKLTGPVASSPTVVASRVYVGDWAGAEWALDADTGEVLASANLGMTTAPQCSPSVLGITSASSVVDGTLYVAGGDDGFYALDALTLQTLWKTPLGDNSPTGGYYGWGSPAVADGLVYQGISSDCDNPFVSGRVDALDAGSGAVKSSADFSQTTDPSHYGSGVWTSPAIDLGARQVFVTTASSYGYGDEFAYSIVRLSLDDLTIQDHWKIPLDEYNLTVDPDWGSSPTLFKDVSGTPLVGAGQKNGYYYAFRREDLSRGPIWKSPIAIPGECPQCGNGTISTAAFDGARLYVGGGYDYSSPGAVTALDPGTGSVLWRTGLDGPVLAPISYANGVVFAVGGTTCVALDSATGALLWNAYTDDVLYGGVAISNGRMFFGDLSGNLYAYEIPWIPK